MSNLSDVFPSPLYPMNDISNCIEDNYYGNQFQHGEMHDIMEGITPQSAFENSPTEKDENVVEEELEEVDDNG